MLFPKQILRHLAYQNKLTQALNVWKWIDIKEIIPSYQAEGVKKDALEKFKIIIDVRSPEEYQEDHIPGAVNIPVLNNDEHKEVGTIYSQDSPLKARIKGSSLIMANLSRHLDQGLLGHMLHEMANQSNIRINQNQDFNSLGQLDNAFSNILIYCKRGGDRSQSVAIILSKILQSTYDTDEIPEIFCLTGGYRSYRTLVREELDILPLKLRFLGLCGLTGSGKTRILRRLKELGEPILDLEQIAKHRGSLFGSLDIDSTQPNQKKFESDLRQNLLELYHDNNRSNKVIWVECESKRVGYCDISLKLWNTVLSPKSSHPRVVLSPANRDIRIRHILQVYDHLTKHGNMDERVKKNVSNILKRICYLTCKSNSSLDDKNLLLKKRLEFLNDGDFYSLVDNLLSHHYDPLYSRNRNHSPQCYPILQIDQCLTDSYIDNILYPKLKHISNQIYSES